MTEADLDRAGRFEAEARELHCRSCYPPGSILLRFRALWKGETARLLRQRSR